MNIARRHFFESVSLAAMVPLLPHDEPNNEVDFNTLGMQFRGFWHYGVYYPLPERRDLSVEGTKGTAQ